MKRAQNEGSSGFLNHFNLHIRVVSSPVFFVTYFSVTSSLFLDFHRNIFSHTFLNLLFHSEHQNGDG